MSEQLDIEQRLRRLEDSEAIKRLKARYCFYADRGFEGAGNDNDEVAALFVEDGIWEGSAALAQGREAISRVCGTFHPFGFHLAINPDVEVDGDIAHGRWWGFIPVTDTGGVPRYSVGVYNDTFVRTPDGWRFKHLHFTAVVKATYQVAWSKDGLVTDLQFADAQG